MHANGISFASRRARRPAGNDDGIVLALSLAGPTPNLTQSMLSIHVTGNEAVAAFFGEPWPFFIASPVPAGSDSSLFAWRRTAALIAGIRATAAVRIHPVRGGTMKTVLALFAAWLLLAATPAWAGDIGYVKVVQKSCSSITIAVTF